MSNGLDANISLIKRVQALKDAGIAFVGRYYDTANVAKRLTRAEAEALTAGNIAIVAVWENGFPTSAEYFSYSKGLADGAAAYAYARDVIQQPVNTPMYFAVDYDASDADIAGAITDYFRGINAAFIRAAVGRNIYDSRYQVGVYGSGAVCARMLARALVSFTWLAQSRGWSGYEAFSGWNIRQGPETTIAGIDCDSDETNGHGGGWLLPAAA